MLIYHGSGEIVKYPRVLKTGHTKDFSWGFYCTKNFDQSKRWAYKKRTPTVNVYEYTPDDTLNVLSFTEVCDEWLDFILLCRSGKTHRYDIVEGPMADDQIWDFLTQWENGLISHDELMMLAKFRHPTHQISFHTIASFDCIRFRRAIQYGQ